MGEHGEQVAARWGSAEGVAAEAELGLGMLANAAVGAVEAVEVPGMSGNVVVAGQTAMVNELLGEVGDDLVVEEDPSTEEVAVEYHV